MSIDPFWPRIGDGEPWASGPPYQPSNPPSPPNFPWGEPVPQVPSYPYIRPYITITTTTTKDEDVDVEESSDERIERLVDAINFLLDSLATTEIGDWATDVSCWQDRERVRDEWLDRCKLQDGDLDI